MTKTESEIQQEIYVPLILHQAGKLEEAKSEYQNLLRLYPDNPDILHLSGVLLHQMGQLDIGLERLTRASVLAPQNIAIHTNLLRLYKALKHIPEQEGVLRTLTDLAPDDPNIAMQFGQILLRQKKSSEAETHLRRCLKIDPGYAGSWNSLGNILEEKGDFYEAEKCYRKCINLEPQYAETFFNLGNSLRYQNKVAESIEALRKAIDLNPDFAVAHVHLAFSLFAIGDIQAAWPEYEWRWKVPNFPTPVRSMDQPLWDGTPLNGKRVLVHSEQGFGDTLQFARFVTSIAGMGGTVLFETPRELTKLVETLPSISQSFARGEPLPEFDYHIPLLSIPYVISTTWGSFPTDTPYLRPDLVKSKDWAGRLAFPKPIKIGITWQSSKVQLSSSFKSCPLSAFAPLFELKDIQWVSLQKEVPTSDVPLPEELHEISDGLNDFSDTAAAIDQLDLVISVDTAVAHLAGALGKPVWLLLSTAGDWRWMVDRKDSPWYPSMHIFRQTEFGDWGSLLGQLVPLVKNISATKN
jgi:Flp pilus assembly protein TadD